MQRGLLASSITLILAMCAYSIWIEPSWIEVTEHDLREDTSADRIRVVQLSDLHLQEVGSLEASVAARIKDLRPDLVILSGDVIDQADALPALSGFLQTLGTVPVVAVLGNWEHWSGVDLDALKKTYDRRPETHLLVNRTLSLSIRGRSLQVTGLDDFTAGQPDPKVAAPEMGSGVRVLVQHSPGFFSQPRTPELPGRFALCLSGHTHGGQVTLFGRPLWTPRGSGPYGSGFYDTSACRLFVSRGIGTSVLPLRLGARPEIAVFDL